MEIIDTLFHQVQLASNILLIGGDVFLAMAVMLLLGLVGLLATTTAQVTGAAENALHPGASVELVQQSHSGVIWFVRGPLRSSCMDWSSPFGSRAGRRGDTC